MSGSTHTCTIPDDIEVEVDFTIEDGEPVVESASIEGGNLDIDRIGIIVGKPGTGVLVALRAYLQEQIDQVAAELVQGCEDQALEDRSDERAGR